MQVPQLLLGLFATASAIDIYLHFDSNCGGSNSAVCTNKNPDDCCAGSTGDIFPSVGFRGIPTDWQLQCRGHSGGNCNNLRQVSPAVNTNFVCLNSGPFSGGGYSIVNGKRAEGANGGASHLPDTLLFGDGAKYNITDLEETPLTQILTIAASGLDSATVPEEFDVYKLE
ncbi:hypothetical protein BKA67DRAFT_696035 [Truncatella angustata]|uniref:Uncharacterized protein n=1 Tax=Truncatella angustata TaxID=152316 RepID=A0A9P8RHV3_9PEZI|nr:uncharacterized protein BKA67DRAFT_696035 [Truncatella angustata]KAH6646137.1 hypothetical protein BKA67DRAFT_696035 [Truncatella angustata]